MNKPIAVLPLCNFGGIEMIELNDEQAVVKIGDKISKLKIHYSSKGSYINLFNRRTYLSEFIRI